MTPCKYIERTGCPSCDQVVYRKCPIFMKAHIQELSKNIVPFKYTKQSFKGDVAFSNSFDVVKSVALDRALSLNTKLVKITLNQAISIALGEEDLEDGVYLVDCSNKLASTNEKIGSALSSFVDKCLYKGYTCFLYKPATIILPITHIPKI